MIVRKHSDGSLLLINQTDHSLLSGRLAAHWGNARFAKPRPFESVVRAAAFHDCGWYRYQTGPMLDEQTGETPSFMNVPLDEVQLGAFQWGTDWLTGIDAYAGLLINKHRTGLWRGRYGAIRYPVAFNFKDPTPVHQEFISRNEARQAQEERSVDKKEFWTNYRLHQVWDYLSLYFCVDEIKNDYIEPVPLHYEGGEQDGVRMTMTPSDARTVKIDPYPFGVPELEIQLVRKRLPKTTFANQTDFTRAFFQARTELVGFRLIS
jgi:hypothetical protein